MRIIPQHLCFQYALPREWRGVPNARMPNVVNAQTEQAQGYG